jgi:hypothetical protein
MLPAGLDYIDSRSPGRERCFQLMETDEPRLFGEWIANWSDLVSSEVTPIVSSAEAAAETAPAAGANDDSADERQTGRH